MPDTEIVELCVINSDERLVRQQTEQWGIKCDPISLRDNSTGSTITYVNMHHVN